MRTDASQAIRALRALRAQVIVPAATSALASAAPDLEDQLRATDAHGDITGATRASYRVYVVTPEDDGSAAAGDGRAAAEGLNPGHGTIVRHDGLGDDVGLVATGFTDYLDDLATQNGGAKDAVTPLVPGAGARLTADIARSVRRRLG